MKKLISIFIVITLALSVFLPNMAWAQEASPVEYEKEGLSGEEAKSYFRQAMYIVMASYKFDISEEELYKATIDYILSTRPELLEEAFTGMFEALDEHSVYYTQEQLDSFLNDMSGELCGIGVLVMTIDEGLLIANVYSNTPAKEVGLRPGDILIKVGDTDLVGMDISVAQRLIAGEENTEVQLTVKRNEQIFEIKPIRRKVVIDSGFYQIIENGTIGYISLYEFSDNASELIMDALAEFDKANITDIIFDLRNNPGGNLREYVDVCNLFIPEGPVIHLEYKNPLDNYTLYSQNKEVKYNLIVLINNNSASASEAFSAAVQDTGVGIVVGETSYGKGTMQNITRFSIGGGIKLTEAEYLSPLKRTINGKGVTPDIRVEDKVTSYEKSDFEKMTYESKPKLGDKNKEVLAIEQRLVYLGFLKAIPDEVFDEATHDAVINFQGITGLYEYGVMDTTTQLRLEAEMRGHEITNNRSLEKAIDVFKNQNWMDFKSDFSDIK